MKERFKAIWHILTNNEYIVFTVTVKNGKRKRKKYLKQRKMYEELVSFRTALLAKEKGFKEYVQFICSTQIINPTKQDLILNDRGYNNEDKNILSFPTQSFLHRWLREVHKIHITVQIGFGHKVWYSFFISKISQHENEDINIRGEKIVELIDYESLHLNAGYDILNTENDTYHFDTYEEALEIGLQESLKLINHV